MLEEEIFAKIIIDKLSSNLPESGSDYTSNTPIEASRAISDGITDYILNHVRISVNYVGVIPGTPPTTDICTDIIPLIGKCLPVFDGNFYSWVKNIETQIMLGFYLGIGVGLVSPIGNVQSFTTPGLTVDQEELKNIHMSSLDSPQLPIWSCICKSIISWIKNISVIPSFPATHIASTGTASKLNILIV